MRTSDGWKNSYWEYLNKHDPIGQKRPVPDRGKTPEQLAKEAAEEADKKYRN